MRNSWHLYRYAVIVKNNGEWGAWRWSEKQESARAFCKTLANKGFEAKVVEAWEQVL